MRNNALGGLKKLRSNRIGRQQEGQKLFPKWQRLCAYFNCVESKVFLGKVMYRDNNKKNGNSRAEFKTRTFDQETENKNVSINKSSPLPFFVHVSKFGFSSPLQAKSNTKNMIFFFPFVFFFCGNLRPPGPRWMVQRRPAVDTV